MNVPRVRSALLLCLASVLLTGCQRKEPAPTPPAPQEVQLRHYFSFGAPYTSSMETLARDFNAGAPGFTLHAQALPHEEFKTRIHEDLARHQTADLYTYWAGARVRSILGQLQPLDDVFPRAELTRLFGSAVVDSASVYQGKAYFVPISQHFVGFFYNKKIFAEHRLQPPKDWAGLLAVAKTLKARGVTPFALGAESRWPAQFWFDYLLLRTAPLDYRQRLMAGEASFDDPQVRHVFTLWHGLLKAGYFNERPNSLAFHTGAGMMLYRGEAAMTLMGTWLSGYLERPELAWEEGSDFGFFPFPVIDPSLPNVALGPIDGLVLPKDAKNPAGAKAAMRYLAKAGSQASISRAMGAVAPNLQVLDRHYSPFKLALREQISRADAWAFNYDLATAPERAEIGLNLFRDFLDAPDQYRSQLKHAAAQMQALDEAVPAPDMATP